MSSRKTLSNVDVRNLLADSDEDGTDFSGDSEDEYLPSEEEHSSDSEIDDRSPLSSGNESDESSDIDSSEPQSMHNSQNMLTDSPGMDVYPHSLHIHQPITKPPASAQFEALKSSTLAHLGGMGNVLYPSALANIPQEVILGLVQSGHLQLHSEEDGSNQFITIPISVANSNSSSSSLGAGGSGSGGAIGSGGGGNRHLGNAGGSSGSSSQMAINKIHMKDLTAKSRSSSSATTTMSSANGRESPPKEGIRIKKEIID